MDMKKEDVKSETNKRKEADDGHETSPVKVRRVDVDSEDEEKEEPGVCACCSSPPKFCRPQFPCHRHGCNKWVCAECVSTNIPELEYGWSNINTSRSVCGDCIEMLLSTYEKLPSLYSVVVKGDLSGLLDALWQTLTPSELLSETLDMVRGHKQPCERRFECLLKELMWRYRNDLSPLIGLKSALRNHGDRFFSECTSILHEVKDE